MEHLKYTEKSLLENADTKSILKLSQNWKKAEVWEVKYKVTQEIKNTQAILWNSNGKLLYNELLT